MPNLYSPAQTSPSDKQAEKPKSWLQRLSNLGKLLSGLVTVVFYLTLIGFFLGMSGVFSARQYSSSEVLYGQGEDQIAIIDISGVLVEGEAGGTNLVSTDSTSTRRIIRVLEEIRKVDKVKAVVIRVNSPGGSVIAAEETLQAIKQFKADTKLPIIVSLGGTAASGGYYVSLGADKIVANVTTITGSIGAIIQTINIHELVKKYGVRSVAITSGKNKDLLNPLEEIDPDQQALFLPIIDGAYNQFIGRILEARPIDRASLLAVADGRVFSGQQAKELGLVDEVGTFADAIDVAKAQAGITEATVVLFGRQGFLQSFLGVISNSLNLTNQLPFSQLLTLSARPAYLFLP